MSANNPSSTPVDAGSSAMAQEQENNQGATLFSSPPRTPADEGRSGSSPPGRFESPNREIGTRQWFNNKKLSDVMIRYGDRRQHVFHGHKVILASSSLWFQAAFTNPAFIESESNEITLEGDEEGPLLMMLQACYWPGSKYPFMPRWSNDQVAASKNTNKFALFHIAMYRVSDKYDAPHIRYHASACVFAAVKGALNYILTVPNNPHAVEEIGLRGILEKVYECTGHRDLNDPLRKAVLDVIMSHVATKPIGLAKPGVIAPEVIKLAKEMPDFGRDMFLRTMGAVPAAADLVAFLSIVEEVQCPHCNHTWAKDALAITVRCIFCGVMHKWK